ncbi:MauE/DoxX family redox-associated membrane protein [Streptosporangium sp. NPDC006013]|uniref:MauE/DoxX family redox-associated membrane protein n=1 Tax=Streptosporangium sp. NPDC006013 TaxID=3155596 RepID=UPI0033B460E6
MAYLIPVCQGLLAVVFLASAASKLRSGQALRAFTTSLVSMRLVRDARARQVAVAVAVAEAVVVVLLAVPLTRDIGFTAAAALLVALFAPAPTPRRRPDGVPSRGRGPNWTAGRH